jgi:hypothetical protein
MALTTFPTWKRSAASLAKWALSRQLGGVAATDSPYPRRAAELGAKTAFYLTWPGYEAAGTLLGPGSSRPAFHNNRDAYFCAVTEPAGWADASETIVLASS